MAIKNVIIHQVRRDKTGEKLTVQLRDTENNIDGLAAVLTEDLLDLFSNASLSIGEFQVLDDKEAQPVFEQKLKKYYDDDAECTDFAGLTKELSKRFESILVSKQLTSVKGGFLVFYQYETRGNNWLAVAILNKTDGIDVSKQLDVIASQVLDLKKLHLGAAINLTQWQTEMNSRYIRFRTGLAVEVRDYFEEFIGCQRDKEAAKHETKELKKAIRTFATNNYEFTEEQISGKVNTAHDFITEQQKEGNQILLSQIANRVFPDQPEEFVKEARENFNLPEDIAIHKASLRAYKKISGRGNGIAISFDSDMLGREVEYKDGVLSIKEIPISLKTALEEELAARKKDLDKE